MTQENKKENLI